MNDLNKVKQIIEENNTFLITSHINPDGDSIASMLALFEMITGLGKKAKMVIADKVPPVYNFLAYYDKIEVYSPAYTKKSFDVAIVIDCGDYNRIEKVKDVIDGDFVLNIDHHIGNPRFGTYNYVDYKSGATTEILYFLAAKLNYRINPALASMLYVGLMTDTGSFRYSNTTARNLKIASELVKKGANPEYLSSMVYERNRIQKFKLLELIFRRMRFFHNDEVIISYISKKDMLELNALGSDSEGLIDFLRSIGTVKAAALLYDRGDGYIKVSLRSKHDVNIMLVANSFGGGGHKNAAGGKIKDTLENAINRILAAILEVL